MCFVFTLHELTNLPSPNWLDNSVGRALNLYRRRHGFESRSFLNLFSGFLLYSCLSCVHYCGCLSFIHLFSLTSVRDAATRQTRNPSLDCLLVNLFQSPLNMLLAFFILIGCFLLCTISIFSYSYFLLSHILFADFNMVAVIVPVVSVVLIAVLIAVFFYWRR